MAEDARSSASAGPRPRGASWRGRSGRPRGRRAGARRGPRTPRPPSRRTQGGGTARRLEGGKTPKSRPVSTERPAANAMTVRSRWTSARRGTPSGWSARSASRETPREEDAGSAAEHGQEDALGQELPQETPAAGAQRGAHRDLAVPRRHAGEEQVRHVDAGDEQDEADGAEQDEQRVPRVSDEGLVEGDHGSAHALVRVRVLRQPIGDGRHLLARALDRDAGLQPPDHPGTRPRGCRCGTARRIRGASTPRRPPG